MSVDLILQNILNPPILFFFLGMLVLEIIFAAKGDSIDYMSFWEGLPRSYRILYIWFNVEFPGNKGFPLNT